MRIIDLLDLVYEEKAPKKILYKYCEYEFDSYSEDYKNKDGLYLFAYLFGNEEQVLCLEVEIIEDKPKKISTQIVSRDIERYSDSIEIINKNIKELTKGLNYLLEKSNNENK